MWIRAAAPCGVLLAALLISRPALAADPRASTDAGTAAIAAANVGSGRVVYYIRPGGLLPEWFDGRDFEAGVRAKLGTSAISAEEIVGTSQALDLIDSTRRSILQRALATRGYTYLVHLELLPKEDRLDVFVYVYSLADPRKPPQHTSIDVAAPGSLEREWQDRAEAARVADEQSRRAEEARMVQKERIAQEEAALARRPVTRKATSEPHPPRPSLYVDWDHWHFAGRFGGYGGILVGEDATYVPQTEASDGATGYPGWMMFALSPESVAMKYADAEVTSGELGAAPAGLGYGGGIELQLSGLHAGVDITYVQATSQTFTAASDNGDFDVKRKSALSTVAEVGFGLPLDHFVPYVCLRGGLYLGAADASGEDGDFVMQANGGLIGGTLGLDYIGSFWGVGARAFAETGSATVVAGGLHVMVLTSNVDE